VLWDLGADVNHPDDQGNSPLLYAISNGMSEDLLTLLIEAGADVNAAGTEGTPLELAVASDRIELAEALLAHDAEASGIDLSSCSEAMTALIQQTIAERSQAEAAANGEAAAAEDAEAAQAKAAAVAASLAAAKALKEAESLKEMEPALLAEFRAGAVRSLLPSLLETYENSPHESPKRRALVSMAYVMQKAPKDILQALPQPTVYRLLSLLEQLFAHDALAIARLALKLVEALLVCGVPRAAQELQRYGALTMVQNLSKANYIKARGLSSESGNTHASDVTELGETVLALFTESLEEAGTEAGSSNPSPKLIAVAEGLRRGDFAAVASLQALLEKEGGVTAFELALCDVPSALVDFSLGGTAKEAPLRKSTVMQVFATPEGEPRRGLRTLVRLLHNIVATGEQLPVYSRGNSRSGQGLRMLTEPTRLCLRSLASLEEKAKEAEAARLSPEVPVAAQPEDVVMADPPPSVAQAEAEAVLAAVAAEAEAGLELELAVHDEDDIAEDEAGYSDGDGMEEEEEEEDDELGESRDEVEESLALARGGLVDALAQVGGGGEDGGLDPIAAAVAAAVRAATFEPGGGGASGRAQLLAGLAAGAMGGGASRSVVQHPVVPDDPTLFLARVEPLVEMRHLEAHILRTCKIDDPAYLQYCQDLVGSVIEERATPEDPASPGEEFKSAVIVKFEKHPTAGLPIHHLRYDDNRIRKCVLAVREYFVVAKGSPAAAEAAEAAGETSMQEDSDPEARVHTISILCPEGFPVDMFLDSVRPAVKRALSQEEPGHAPMNRPPGAQYQWPDRGWKRESEFNDSLEGGLNGEGMGVIARGQTQQEAEVLVNRLADVVVALITVDKSRDYTTAAAGAGRPEQKFTRGMRVHGLISGGDWTPGTVLGSEKEKYEIVFDDGTWESGVGRTAIRPTGQADKRRRGLVPGDAASFSEFLRRHLGGGVAQVASNAENALSDSAGHITRSFPAFETGSVNRAGHVDLQAVPGANNVMVPAGVPAKRLRVAFGLEACEQGGKEKRSSKKSKPSPTVPVPVPFQPSSTLLHSLQHLMDTRYKSTAQPAPAGATYTLVYQILAAEAEKEAEQEAGTSEGPSSLETCGFDHPGVRSAIQLLAMLHSEYGAGTSRCGTGAGGSAAIWASRKLTQKLLRQLEDPLSVASGALPAWCDSLTGLAPFLFSLEARRKLLESTGFGVSHSVYWVQEQVAELRRSRLATRRAQAERATAEAEESGDVEAVAEAADRLAEVEDEVGRDRIGQLKSDIAKVKRDGLVSQGIAQRLMALHAGSMATLEVQFEGEDGFGKGVTQNFYAAVAIELQSRAENAKVPLFVADESGTEGYIHVGSTKGAGLFPQPLGPGTDPAKKAEVCERYRFVGRLLAKACRDGFIVPLPLSNSLFSLLRGEPPGAMMLPLPGSTGGVVRAYALVCRRVEAVANNGTLSAAEKEARKKALLEGEFARRYMGADYDMALPAYLESADVCFVDPISGAVLQPGGEEARVTVSNLAHYVDLVVEAWLGEGIKDQILAMKEGIREVFPLEKLGKFSGAELKYMLCGDNTIDWEAATLEQHLQPVAPLNRDSPCFIMLCEQLLDMSNQERSDFLNFVTACPRLPPGGLGALGIEVTAQRSQSMIPTAQTCVPKLYLPEYTDGAALRTGMMEAFKNADSGGFHENNVWHN